MYKIPRPWSMRAIILFATGSLCLLLWSHLPDRRRASEIRSTKVGQHLTTGMSDNSVLEINTNTSISLNYSSAVRDLRLTQGEAYFDVARHDPRTFVVEIGDVSIRTLGASFAVRRHEQGSDVSVEVSDGTVLMREAMTQIGSPRRFVIEATIPAGHRASLRQGILSVGVFSKVDADCAWAWRRDHICFTGETLSAAIEEVNRYSTRKFIIRDPTLLSITMGGNFRVGDVSSFLAALQRTFGIHAIVQRDSIVLVRACTDEEPQASTRIHHSLGCGMGKLRS